MATLFLGCASLLSDLTPEFRRPPELGFDSKSDGLENAPCTRIATIQGISIPWEKMVRYPVLTVVGLILRRPDAKPPER